MLVSSREEIILEETYRFLLYMLATDDMALLYSQQLAILLSINHALIHLDGGIKSG